VANTKNQLIIHEVHRGKMSIANIEFVSNGAKKQKAKKEEKSKSVVLDLFDINGNVNKTKIGTSSNICIIGGSDAALDVLLSKLKIAYRQQQNINLKEIDAEEFCVKAKAFPNLRNYVVPIDILKADEITIFKAMFYSSLHIVFKLDGVSLNSEIGGVRLSGTKNIQILKNLHGKIQKEKNKLVASLKEEEFALMTHLHQHALSLKEYCNLKEVSNA